MVRSLVVREEESKKGSCNQMAVRLAMLKSVLSAMDNEKNRNYLRRGELIPHD